MGRKEPRGQTATLSTAVVSAVAGCGYNSGFVRGADNVNQHQYVMQVTSPPRFVRTVSGSYSVDSFLCVLREDVQFSCFLVFGSQKLTVSADVYEIPHAPPPAPDHPTPPPPADHPTASPPDRTHTADRRAAAVVAPTEGPMGPRVPSASGRCVRRAGVGAARATIDQAAASIGRLSTGGPAALARLPRASAAIVRGARDLTGVAAVRRVACAAAPVHSPSTAELRDRAGAAFEVTAAPI